MQCDPEEVASRGSANIVGIAYEAILWSVVSNILVYTVHRPEALSQN